MRLIILAFLLYLLYRMVRGIFHSKDLRTDKQGVQMVDDMVMDPECNTYIPLRDAHRRTIQGKEFFFCSSTCADQYEKNSMNR